MFNLNPCNYDFAWWQQLLMLLGAGILGYLLGGRKSEINQLGAKLSGLEADCEDCLKGKSLKVSVADSNPIAVKADLSADLDTELPEIGLGGVSLDTPAIEVDTHIEPISIETPVDLSASLSGDLPDLHLPEIEVPEVSLPEGNIDLDVEKTADLSTSLTTEIPSIDIPTVESPSLDLGLVGAGVAALGGVVAGGIDKLDDLKKIEGIGPKIEQLLHEAGIKTFDILANSQSATIKEILVAAGSRFQMHDPTTWPEQARLAAEGKWEELKVWQDALNKGKE